MTYLKNKIKKYKKIKITKKKIFFSIILILLFANILNMIIKQPSNNREWEDSNKILAYSKIENNLITINNIRNFSYKNYSNYEKNYYNKTFNLNDIKKVYYILQPFSSFEGLAHSFLTFEFEDENKIKSYISISVEIRREIGEDYSPIKGIFRNYELVYVIGDENDLIGLRSIRDKPLNMYPINTPKEKIQKLFLNMIKRNNKLYNEPEFYNTLTSTCTTNILDHVNELREEKISYSSKVLFPGFSDEIVFKSGLIDTKLNFTEAKKKFVININAKKYRNTQQFSEKIREFN